MARKLAVEPENIFLNEPFFGSLDLMAGCPCGRRFRRWAGTAIVFVTHDKDEAIFLDDRIAVMTS
jgi:NitT/TauT family transport system ATP-binding protein